MWHVWETEVCIGGFGG